MEEPKGDVMATEESRTPKHGRHAAGRHAAPAATTTPTPAPTEAAPEVVPVADASLAADVVPTPVEPIPAAEPLHTASVVAGDQELSMEDAPAPIGVDPHATGSFSRITAAEGARVTTRANASDTAALRAQGIRPVEAVRMSTAGRPHVERRETAVEANGRVFAVLGLAAVLVVGIVGWLLVRALVSVDQAPEQQVLEQVQAGASDPIEYRGVTYALKEQEGGGYALTSTSENQEGAATLFELKGTPVALVLYDTAFIIPENLPDGTWDLVAYHLGGGSVTQQVTDADGKPIVQEGEISTATLAGDDIQVVTAAGETFVVSLV